MRPRRRWFPSGTSSRSRPSSDPLSADRASDRCCGFRDRGDGHWPCGLQRRARRFHARTVLGGQVGRHDRGVRLVQQRQEHGWSIHPRQLRFQVGRGTSPLRSRWPLGDTARPHFGRPARRRVEPRPPWPWPCRQPSRRPRDKPRGRCHNRCKDRGLLALSSITPKRYKGHCGTSFVEPTLSCK